MTSEEAIETIRILLSRAEELDGPNLLPDEEEALEMAIEALKQQNKRCKICEYFHNINSRLFTYYCPNCGTKMEVEQ